MQTFTIPLRLPSLNEIILASSTVLKGGIRFGSKYSLMKKEAASLIGMSIREHNIVPIKGPFTASFIWKEKNKRRDPDNIAAAVKFIFDSLQKEGIIVNDNWKYNLGWSNKFEISTEPEVVVELLDLLKLARAYPKKQNLGPVEQVKLEEFDFIKQFQAQ